MVGPLIGFSRRDLDEMAAFVVAAVDQQPARAGFAFRQGDLLRPPDHVP